MTEHKSKKFHNQNHVIMKAVITARFNSTCAETGRPIKKGEPMVYDYQLKKCYARGSATQIAFAGAQDKDPASGMIEDEQNARFKNWYQQNY